METEPVESLHVCLCLERRERWAGWVRQIIRGLIAQGRSAHDGISCRYRTADGRKCGIGQLIPDHLYRPEMENEFFSGLFTRWPAVATHLGAKDNLDLSFLILLQNPLHDGLTRAEGVVFRECVYAAGRMLAAVYDLEIGAREEYFPNVG